MMKVLFLNHKIKKCGVYQYGLRLYEILYKSDNIMYLYEEISSFEEYSNIIKNINFDVILYNYHFMTMPWLNVHNIQKNKKNIGIQHDLEEYMFFNIILRLDVTLKEEKNKYNIPRPIYENIENILNNNIITKQEIKNFIDYSEPNIPIIGSFGFGFTRKGFHKIINIVNEQYNNAIIKLLIPEADTTRNDINIETYCINLKPGIKVLIYKDFIENTDILHFLHSNTINLFMYDSHDNAGLSSVIDYALSVKKPIGISDANWFRHIYSDDICVYKYPIDRIIQSGFSYYKQYLDDFSNKKLIKKIDSIIMNKKRIAILYSGQMRLNSLNTNEKKNTTILNSISDFLLTEKFIKKYDYDIFIGTDNIDIYESYNFFGENLKNIHIAEKNWFLYKPQEEFIPFEYFQNKYIDTIHFNGSNTHINGIYPYYRLFCTYLLMKDYQKNKKIEYDYIIRIRPDSRLIQDITSMIELLEETNRKIFIEHDHFFIINYEFENILRFIEHYGYINNSLDIYTKTKTIFKHLARHPIPTHDEENFKFCPERLFMEYIYYVITQKNKDFEKILIGAPYPSFQAIYRGINSYAYCDFTDDKITPFHSIEFLKVFFVY